jgi:serine protease AprX
VPLDRWQPSDSGRLIDSAKLRNAYNFAVQAPQLWNQRPVPLQGQGVTVAVVDSGIFKTQDLKDAVAGNANFSKANRLSDDQYGHGTFVAGLIAGNGKSSDGAYIGIAPRANLLNVRISNDEGMATEADVVEALQWLHQQRAVYNVRVVNLSLNAATPQSYHSSPMAAAVEVLWFSGIVVVVSAGNNGVNSPGVLLPPANDPFVITVGAADDKGTASIQDDVVAPFSAHGITPEGFAKPELVAPGVRLVAPLPSNDYLNMSRNRDANRIDKDYFRMSGTSMAAPIVSGAVALLLQDEPHLTPDQVKHRLMSTANKSWPGYSPAHAGAGYLDIYAAVHANSSASANSGIPASQLLWTGPNPVTWSSVNWGSVNWGSVNWGSVNWGSVNWGSVNWGSDYWEGE